MKKFYATSYCLLIFFVTTAQVTFDSLSQLHFTPATELKATVLLKSNVKRSGTITWITDSAVELLQSFEAENGTTFTSASLAVRDIESIKIKRHAFFLGLTSGAIVTGFVGYGLGQSSYNDDPGLSDEENKNNAEAKGFKGAAIGVLPGAVIGGLIGSAVIRRKFKINGDSRKIKSMVKALSHYYIGKKNHDAK